MRYKRKDCLDKFYTSRQTAKKCVNTLDLNLFDLVIEPSAGDGSFLDTIIHPNIIALDISPARTDITQQNFFEYKTNVPSSKVLIVGNPPFGKQNNLAIRFINYAATIADTIAFILPLSFNKESVHNKVCPYLHLDSILELEVNSFLFQGETYDVPSVFQVWKKGTERTKSVPPTPIDYEYTKASEANLCIRRVGYYAGKSTTDLTKNKESHFFIKVHDESKVNFLIEGLNNYQWKHNNTVGPRTVTKYDLNPLINELISKS